MKRSIFVGAILLLMLPSLALARARDLCGQVVLVGPHDETTPAVGVDVTLKETGDTVRTKAQGLFRLFLPDLFKAGETINVMVEKTGWRIQYPLDGEERVPANLEKDIIEIRLLPVGSKKFWTEDRIQKFIEDTAARAREQVKPEGQPEEIDFGRYIKEWAAQYGFSGEQAKGEIDKWVAEVQKKQDDFHKLGLAAYAERNFVKAAALFTESAETKANRLEMLTEEAKKLREETVRDFRLAGDARYNNYEFDKALVAYQRVLDYLPREQNPRLWATVLIDIGMAQGEIGIRAAGPAIHAHLNGAVQAYHKALEVYTRKDLPQQWATTQNNLGAVLQNQGIRTVGEAGTRLLGEAVQAYQKALEVRTRKDLPQDWAMTQNNLGEAYMMLENWANAAASYVNVLYVYPDYRKAYKEAHFLYHEKLFAFADAFALNETWVERHPGDIFAESNFTEVHFTTGRFDQAESRFAALLANPDLETPQAIVLQALEIATLLALNKDSAIPPKLEVLRAAIAAQPERLPIGWTFAGAKHFIRQHKRLADHNWLIELLSALEKTDRSTVLAVLDAAQHDILAVEEN
jgi:tetratricopeptide (TPR) repeat protein